MAKKPRQTRHVRKRKKANIEQRLSAWELAGQGRSLRAIAKELKLSGPQQAKNLVDKGFEEFYSPKVDELRARFTEGFSQLQAVFFKKAVRGDAESAREWREQVAALRKLYGVDAPTRTEHTGKDGGPITIDFGKLTDEQLRNVDAQIAERDVESDVLSPAPRAGEGGASPT